MQVGAILVDCNEKVIGKGWNRMPVGCEDRFSWKYGNDVPFKDGKHLYGKELASHYLRLTDAHTHSGVCYKGGHF